MSTTGLPDEVTVAVDRDGGVDLVLGDDGEGEQERHDEHGDDGVDDLDGHVLVELAGHLVGALPVADDRPEDQEEDHATDDDAGGHHARVQLEGVLALGGGAPAGAVATGRSCSRRAPGERRRPARRPSGPSADAGAGTPPARRSHRAGAGCRPGGASGTGCECVHGDDTSGHRSESRSWRSTCFRPDELPVHKGAHDRSGGPVRTASPTARPPTPGPPTRTPRGPWWTRPRRPGG